MKKFNVAFIIVPILLFGVIIFIFYFNDTKQLYGNDRESIMKVIKSIEGYENRSIEILQVKDFNHLRIVAFLSNNSPGYIEFHKDKDGNYVWKHIEVKHNEPFSSFLLHLNRTENPRFMFITNNENEIAKMQVTVNEHKLEQEFLPNQVTVTWVDLPQTDKSEYTFQNYKYYDKDGNLIKEY
jgi:hypothetical protein